MSLRSMLSFLSSDLAIDLGTANTCVYARGQGIVINEPSIVAVNHVSGQIEAVGLERIQSNGYSFQIELKLRARRAGYTLREVPIVFTERDSGESKMSGRIIREAVWRVWALRILDLLGKL